MKTKGKINKKILCLLRKRTTALKYNKTSNLTAEDGRLKIESAKIKEEGRWAILGHWDRGARHYFVVLVGHYIYFVSGRYCPI
jgi:hypothetical protein